MNTSYKQILAWGAFLCGLAVVLGAMGAHTLRETFHLEPRYLDVFETGVRYQFFHAIAIMLVALIADKTELNLKWVKNLFIIGIIIFSGSLYFLATRNLYGMDAWGWVGAITPFGGLSLIGGWFLLAYKLFKSK